MANKFLSFIDPAMAYVDNGHFFRKPFRWLYVAFACLHLVIPVVMLFMLFSKFTFAGVCMWLVVTFVSWLAFQLWWNRRDKVYDTSGDKDDFVAIPVFSHFIQTAGECSGLWIGVGGALMSLLAGIFGASAGLPSQVTNFGWAGIVVCPLIGFITIVMARVVAEIYRALAAIANNTKKK